MDAITNQIQVYKDNKNLKLWPTTPLKRFIFEKKKEKSKMI